MAAGQAGEAPVESGGLVTPSSQEGEPASEPIAQGHLGRCGRARKISTMPHSSDSSDSSFSRSPPPGKQVPSHPLISDCLGVVKEGQIPPSCPGSSWEKEVVLYLAECSLADSGCGICYAEVQVAKSSSRHKPSLLHSWPYASSLPHLSSHCETF